MNRDSDKSNSHKNHSRGNISAPYAGDAGGAEGNHWQPFDFFNLSPAAVEQCLGKEWVAIYLFFPRLVSYSLQEAREQRLQISSCKLNMLAQLPVTLEDALPFIVRHIWNTGAQPGEQRTEDMLREFFQALSTLHGNLSWTYAELEKEVSTLMER